jgi:hypothetical protein
MSTPVPNLKLRRNVKALFLLGFVITAVSVLGGGTLLLMGHSHQEVEQPVWKTGQQVLLIGLTNLMIYLGLFFQVRKVLSQSPGDPGTWLRSGDRSAQVANKVDTAAGRANVADDRGPEAID